MGDMQVHFPRYLSSDIYYRYLSDLINTVQMAQDLPVRKHHRQGEICSVVWGRLQMGLLSPWCNFAVN